MKASWFRLGSLLLLTAFGTGLSPLGAEIPATPSVPIPTVEATTLAVEPAPAEPLLDELFANRPDPKVVLNCSWADKPTKGCYYLWNPATLCCRLSGVHPNCPTLICL